MDILTGITIDDKPWDCLNLQNKPNSKFQHVNILFWGVDDFEPYPYGFKHPNMLGIPANVLFNILQRILGHQQKDVSPSSHGKPTTHKLA